MNIETLKQGLQQILNEDLSNRSSISELRRNVFLHTSKTEQTESMLASKEKAISDLSSDIAYYKNQISLREKSIEENAGSFKAERDSLLDLINEKEIRITELVKQTEVLKETEVRFDLKNQEVNRLMLENSNYAAKIREMAEYIAGMEVNREQMEKEYASVKIKADWAEKFKKEMENSKSEILKLNDILITEKQDNEAMKIQLTGLNSELQNNNFELINELNSLKLKSEESIDVLREELVQMENLSVESINSLQEQIGTLKQQLISDQNNSEKSLELELLNKEITNKIQLLNQQLAEMKIQLDSSESGLQLQMNEVAEIKAENEKLREGNAENLRLLADVDEEKKLLSLNVVSLNQSIDEWSSKFHAVDLKFQEVNLKCNELNVLNESLLSFRENYISAQQQITELERQLLEIQLNLSDAISKDEHEQLRSELEIVKGNLSTVQQEKLSITEQLENQLKNATTQILQLETELANLKSSGSINQEEGQSSELKHENKRLQMLTGMLKKRVAELESSNDNIKDNGQISNEIERLQSLADDLNSEKIRSEQTIIDLKRELFKAEEKLSEQENKGKTGEFEALTLENVNLNNQKQELENQVTELLNKFSELGRVTDSENEDPTNLEKPKNSVNLASVLNVSFENKKTLKLKINEMVKEIDRCISMLNAKS